MNSDTHLYHTPCIMTLYFTHPYPEFLYIFYSDYLGSYYLFLGIPEVETMTS